MYEDAFATAPHSTSTYPAVVSVVDGLPRTTEIVGAVVLESTTVEVLALLVTPLASVEYTETVMLETATAAASVAASIVQLLAVAPVAVQRTFEPAATEYEATVGPVGFVQLNVTPVAE